MFPFHTISDLFRRECARWISATLALVPATLVPMPVAAGSVSAGAEIVNVARVDGMVDGRPLHALSNVARLRVDEVLDVSLEAIAAGAAAGVDRPVPARLLNRGNGTEIFHLETRVGPHIHVTGLAIDGNANGVFDASMDTPLGADALTDAIGPAAAVTILILFRTDVGVPSADLGSITLVASAVTGTGSVGRSFAGQADGGGDAIVGCTSARAELVLPLPADALVATLTKTQRVTDPQGGDSPVAGAVITYTLAASFAGRGSITDVRISDPVPAGTRYVAGSLRLDGTPLADGDGASISVALGTITGPADHVVTFQAAIH